MVKRGLAENTIRRTTGVLRQFFKVAVRRELIPSNPFDGLPAAIQRIASRFYFVTRQDAEKVLDACPDADWRLLFALARFGGLRCPSETLALQRSDVDWARGRIRVPSPKTAHHEGGDARIIPMFPELRPLLLDAFERAEPGAEYVIGRYRDTQANLRTQLNRIIRRAGLTPWPKLWQNLRSSRETELAETWPLHVVCAWIGNSRPVAMKHYLQVLDEHFEKAAQNAAQQAPELTRMERNDESRDLPEALEMQPVAQLCNAEQHCRLGVRGLEPLTSCMSSRRSSQLS